MGHSQLGTLGTMRMAFPPSNHSLNTREILRHIISWGTLSFLLIGGLLFTISPEVPEQELAETQQALEKAWDEGAFTFAPLAFSNAEQAYQAAQEEIQEQQRRWRWERDYSLATEMLVWARIDSNRAFQEAVEAKEQTRAYLGLRTLDPLPGSVPIKDPPTNEGSSF